ncbi:unnamed protein product [Phytomonas sp. EM1]|nr:unnamed protein product [Phytomonas sp. EM1]|eukprot:CCW60145.1 unnamed protein product [Phytomonas sp. isolate EM1]
MDRRAQASECDPNSGYIPATPQNTRAITFNWARACSAYTLCGPVATHHGGGKFPYRPVIGDVCMSPNTGRYWLQLRVNTSDCRIGFCTTSAYPSNRSLEECELGDLPVSRSSKKSSGSVSSQKDESTSSHQTKKDSLSDATTVAYVDMQTSNVYVNGEKKKQLWRTFIAGSGALFSFVVDTKTGMIQLFVDKKYIGMAFDASAKLKGKRLVPCVGIGGFDMSNTSMGMGKLSASVSPACPFDALY